MTARHTVLQSIARLDAGRTTKREDFARRTDKELVDWLFEEVFELKDAQESHSANRLFNTLCELNDCHNLLNEVVARGIEHPVDTARVRSALIAVSNSEDLAVAYLNIARLKSKLRKVAA